MIQPRNFPGKPRFGCVGTLVLMTVGVTAFLVAAQVIFTPWGFYLGGHFHLIPIWQGMATAHASNGQDYIIFLSIYPDAPHTGRYANYLRGNGFLCSPKGEKFRMKVGASMEKHLPLDTQGKLIHIWMHRTSTWNTIINSDYRPSISFEGNWGYDQIPVDDKNSLGRAFGPDGSVYLGRSSRGPSFPPVQFTLRAASASDFQKACSQK